MPITGISKGTILATGLPKPVGTVLYFTDIYQNMYKLLYDKLTVESEPNSFVSLFVTYITI